MPLLAALAASVLSTQVSEVPFRIAEDAIVVDAVINGRKGTFMFDTGFGGSVVVATPLNLGPPTGTIVLRDFVGELSADTVKLRSFRLGNKQLDVTGMGDAVLRGGANYSYAYNTHVDGVMGFDAIKKEITEINFEKSKFIFHPPSVDISKRVPDNKRTFLARLLPVGNNSLEMPIELPNGKRMTLALDTGNSFYATTHTDVLERVGLWKAGRKADYMGTASVASGPVDTYTVQMPAIKIYGIPTPPSVWDVIDLPSSSADGDGTVGFGFLKNFNITIDYERRRVWFENFTGKIANEVEGEVGISAFYNPPRKRTLIVAVAPASPADKAGLKAGDELLSVAGTELIEADFRRVSRMLAGPVGSKVAVVASRRGTLVRAELERKALVNSLD